MHGRQICLAKGPEDDPQVKDKAWSKFNALLSGYNLKTEGDRSPVYAVLNAYLVWVKSNRPAKTLELKKRFLRPFSDKFGTMAVADLQEHHLEKWLDEQQEDRWNEKQKKFLKWGSTSRRLAISTISGALTWGVKKKYISVNPFKDVEKPAAVSRGIECLVTDEHYRKLFDLTKKRKKGGYHYFLTALYETGARPGEILGLEAKHFHPDIQAWVIEGGMENVGRNKHARRGKRIVIYVPDKLLPVVQKLNEQYPTGPIFRTESGTLFSRPQASHRFWKLKKKLKLPKALSLYGLRHAYATAYLKNGGSAAILAELMNTSVAMIQKHYGHLDGESKILRKAANFRAAEAQGPGQPVQE